MREIKFRAWDDGKMICPTGALANIQRFFRIIREDAILMQYTGLKDKNGKEIYEEDIVEMIELKYGKKYFTGKVINHGYMGITIDTEYDYMDFDCKGYAYEVIGNIYENPELLK